MHDPDDATRVEETLEETARNQNSNLQRLIEAVGLLIAASRDLLGRLQHEEGARQDGAAGEDRGNEKGQGDA